MAENSTHFPTFFTCNDVFGLTLSLLRNVTGQNPFELPNTHTDPHQRFLGTPILAHRLEREGNARMVRDTLFALARPRSRWSLERRRGTFFVNTPND